MTSATIEAGDGLALTVGALLAERAADLGDVPLLVCDDDALTYRDAEARSALLARALIAAGFGRGAHVGLLHPNGSAFVVGWLAAARIGAVTVPLSTFSRPAELTGLLAGTDVEVLLSAPGYRSHRYDATLREAIPELDLVAPPPLHAPAVASLRRIAFSEAPPDVDPGWTVAALFDGAASVDTATLAAAEAAVGPADRMVIVHTSGSTSVPKGVIHTHGALIRHMDNLNQMRRYTSDEILFSNSPFFWIGGFAFSLLATLVAGGRLVCSNSASAAGVLDLLEAEQPTLVNGYAQGVAHLPDDPSFPGRDLSSIRRGNLWPIMPPGTAPSDVELRHAMLGMTETASVCLLSDDDTEQPERLRGSFGKPAPGFEAKVVDPATLVPCRVGEVGELWVRGPFLMEGYYGRERSETFEPDGWFRTGDLVAVDAEGFFYFKGRAGDLIKAKGASVSPREVEAAIAELTGLTAHVTGLDAGPHDQVVAAAVVVPEGGEFGEAAIAELRARLAERLSAYKVPKVIRALPAADVPLMSSGKLDAPALRTLLGRD